jgi:hypothetical protein
MTTRSLSLAVGAAAAALAIAGCKSDQAAAPNTAGDTTAGSGGGTTAGAGSGSGTSLPALVNVDLRNVLNDLSVAIKVDRANIPVNAQVPIEVAANVCGVSVSALAASVASGTASCTATTTSPQLVQSVQQQVAAGGNVGGGAQTMGTTNNSM